MEYVSLGSFLMARSLNISACTHFGEIFKALKVSFWLNTAYI